MFLHLGTDVVVAMEEVISINEYRSFHSAVNREFLQNMRQQKKVVDISEKHPKSFIVTASKVYLSAISSMTLRKRAENLFYNEEE